MIYQKLLEVQKVGISVSKDGTNPHFKSKYMTLDNIIETSNPILTKAGLVVTHYCRDGMVHTKIVDTDKDGGDVESSFPLAEGTPQQMGSSITYAKRYNLAALLNICSDEDDDGNKASGITYPKVEKKDILDSTFDQPYPVPDQNGKIPGSCNVCGSKMNPGKNGRPPYCYDCWKRKQK